MTVLIVTAMAAGLLGGYLLGYGICRMGDKAYGKPSPIHDELPIYDGRDTIDCLLVRWTKDPDYPLRHLVTRADSIESALAVATAFITGGRFPIGFNSNGYSSTETDRFVEKSGAQLMVCCITESDRVEGGVLIGWEGLQIPPVPAQNRGMTRD